LAETPEFYWELEVKRLARDFHPKEKLDRVALMRGPDDVASDTDTAQEATSEADSADFEAALKDGEIKPPNLDVSANQHGSSREYIENVDEKSTQPLPSEFECEFADYDRGAFAFRRGNKHWDEAGKEWLTLLNRPAAERHYRTVWAAFMLGKMAMAKGDPEAVDWFEKTRQYAAQGFSDSLGMAADSYGWEARSEWKSGHPEKAAPLYLNQMALGDESAVASLKVLIPDQPQLTGTLDEQSAPLTTQEKVAAGDPLLRRVVTAHILADESGDDVFGYPNNDNSDFGPSTRWLKAVHEAHLSTVDDAEYLGWVAYMVGRYAEAQRWLDLCRYDTPAADWLRAKLELRSGRIKDAARNMEKAWSIVRNPSAYTGWTGPGGVGGTYKESEWNMTMEQWATGDLGAVRLLRSDFVQALDTFLKGGLWDDAAYVGERVLTTDELQDYVESLPPPAAVAKPPGGTVVTTGSTDTAAALRYLLGRRLVREQSYATAERYLLPPYAKLVEKYAQALKDGANETLQKEQREEAFSTAAWLARFDGMEMMGSEVAPDDFQTGGAFPSIEVARNRISGQDVEDTDGKDVTVPMPILPGRAEVRRLKENRIRPDVRFHYRVIAASLAMRAAAFMDDNTEELADALNTAGMWASDRDDKLGDRFYGVIEERCAATKIGKDVIAQHWFVDEPGPWSNALKARCDALHSQLGVQQQP